MAKKLTHEDYLQKLNEKNIKVIPIESYIKWNRKIKHKCSCGTIWEQSPGKILQGLKCINCHGRKYTKKSTHIEYTQKLQDKDIKIIPTENYINAITKIGHKCSCGINFHQSPNKILSGRKCGKCKNGRTHISHDEYISKLSENIKLLEEYKGTHTKLKFMCSCGNETISYPGLMIKGCHCEDKRYEHNVNYYKNKKTILYYIKVNNLYKVGITIYKENIDNSILKNRFRQDINKGISIEIIKTKVFENGSEAYINEQSILSKFKKYKYLGENILRSGNSEMFIKNIKDINEL